eukprot:6206763-Pleurochrysis_carterae.AAC.3
MAPLLSRALRHDMQPRHKRSVFRSGKALVLRLVDTDGSGAISFVEFCAAVGHLAAPSETALRRRAAARTRPAKAHARAPERPQSRREWRRERSGLRRELDFGMRTAGRAKGKDHAVRTWARVGIRGICTRNCASSFLSSRRASGIGLAGTHAERTLRSCRPYVGASCGLIHTARRRRLDS